MLAAWGHSEAHFIGHSFGTIVVSWVMKNSQVVTSACLLDPVCFLLAKHDVLSNALYRLHEDPIQVALTYFVFRELHVAHTLARNFFWQQAELWPETVSRPMLVLLSGCDAIVPAHSVRRLLQAEQNRRRDVVRVAELARSGAVVVNQSGERSMQRCKSSAGGFTDIQVSRSSDLQIAQAKLEVLWFPDIVHCQFAFVPSLRKEVAKASCRFIKQAENPQMR